MSRKLFCDINPTCYKISKKKENIKKSIKDFLTNTKIAKAKNNDKLPNLVKGHFSLISRKLNGVDFELQLSKKTNIVLACEKINGLIIKPGETFSFWKTLGEPTIKKGYQKGLTIRNGKFESGIGGGLCQMANLVHFLVLNSPLIDTEIHHHSDALFPDEKRRVPFGTGTGVSYSSLDYRFKNITNQNVQLLTWVDGNYVYGELRSEKEYPYKYKLIEENHHFHKENKKYYRISQVYQIKIDRKNNN